MYQRPLNSFMSNLETIWDGLGTVVLTLGHTVHVADGAFVQFSNHIVFENDATLDLTAHLIRLAIARVDANDIGQTLWIGNAFGQRQLALVQQTRANGRSIYCLRRCRKRRCHWKHRAHHQTGRRKPSS
jgi:hypothetical protein